MLRRNPIISSANLQLRFTSDENVNLNHDLKPQLSVVN